MKLDKFRQSLVCDKIEPGAVLDTARKASLVMLFGTGGKFVVADQKIAGRNKAHCIYIQNKAES